MNAVVSVRCMWTGFPTVCALIELCITEKEVVLIYVGILVH